MAATKRKNMNPRIERKITRISGVREVKQTFLIICEGVNTEPDYFNAFRLTSANVKALWFFFLKILQLFFLILNL